MTSRTVAQSAQERFSALVLELDSDYCNNSFGASPCAAGIVQAAQTAQAAASKSLTLSAAASAVDDAYKNMLVRVTSGSGAGQERNVLTSRRNLTSYSQNYSNAAWTKYQTTVGATAIAAPDGTLSAYPIIETAVAGLGFGVYRAPALGLGTYTHSVFAKPYVGSRFVRLCMGGIAATDFACITVDVSNGTITQAAQGVGAVSNVSGSVSLDNNGFYRITLTATLTLQFTHSVITNSGSAAIGTNYGWEIYTGDGVSGVYLWGDQTQTGSFATEYIHTEANAAEGIAVDVPWSSNLLTRSNDWSNTQWTLTGTATRTGTNQINLPAVSDGCYNLTGISPANKYITYQIKVSGSGTIHFQITNNVDQGFMSAQITLTSTPTLYTETHLFNGTASNLALSIQRVAGDTATSVTLAESQVEIGSTATPYIATTSTPALLPDATSVYDLIDRPNACYNTYGTCKSKPNYAKGIKTFKFCLRGQTIPTGAALRPYITSHSFTPTEIPVGGGLAVRSQTTITMADETCSDYEADKYASVRATPAGGTFWSRFIARNYNIAGRFARVRKGYVTTPWDWTVFQNELYLITSITGPDTSGNVQIVLADVTKTLDQNMLPKASNGTLQADFKAIENTGIAVAGAATTITLPSAASALDGAYVGMEVYVTQNTGAGQRRTITAYVGATRVATVAAWSVNPDSTSVYQVSALSINVGTGKGAQYDDPVATGLPQFVRIGNEVIQYDTVTGDVLAWSSSNDRAQFGTALQDHKTGDGVQLCFAPVAQSVTNVIHRLANAAAIPDAYIDLAGLALEDTNWYGAAAAITACIHTPEKASGLLNELLAILNLNAWWDAVSQQFKFRADMPQIASSVPAITPNETIGKSMQVTPLDALRITRSFLSFSPISATANMAQANNFGITNGYIDASAESANEYNAIISDYRYSRWLCASNSLFVAGLVARRVSRLRDAPFKLSCSLDPRNEVHIGDLVDISTRKKTDASGAPVVTRMRVTKYLDNKNIDIEAISSAYSMRYAFIAPDGTPDYPTDTNYAHISLSTGLMSDGTNGYAII